LGAAVRFLAEHAREIRLHERVLSRRLHEGAVELGGFRVLGPAPDEPRVPIVALVHESIAADRIAFALDRRYGIAARAGLHCAPWAHRTLGTSHAGALRFGLGYGNTEEHVDMVLAALRDLVDELT
jgi:selenocysteine lyase/cysteine desulfurase